MQLSLGKRHKWQKRDWIQQCLAIGAIFDRLGRQDGSYGECFVSAVLQKVAYGNTQRSLSWPFIWLDEPFLECSSPTPSGNMFLLCWTDDTWQMIIYCTLSPVVWRKSVRLNFAIFNSLSTESSRKEIRDVDITASSSGRGQWQWIHLHKSQEGRLLSLGSALLVQVAEVKSQFILLTRAQMVSLSQGICVSFLDGFPRARGGKYKLHFSGPWRFWFSSKKWLHERTGNDARWRSYISFWMDKFIDGSCERVQPAVDFL